jgi:hypothetical protein
MGVPRLEKFLASGIYLLMVASTVYVFANGISNALSIAYQYTVDAKLLLGAALAGSATLLVSAILLHFRPVEGYVIAMIALQLLILAFFPLMTPIILEILIHRTLSVNSYGLMNLFPIVLLLVIAVFTPLRLLRLVGR